jgi:catechol 2,3-dioxygenase-like lactoylglutathione lyase family enzyme
MSDLSPRARPHGSVDLSVSVKGIDHLVIRGSDLDASETAYRKLGFSLTPRGFHAGRGSANHTAPLSGGNYFELLQLPAGGDGDSFPDREGLVAIALSPNDSRAIYAELTMLGYQVEPPRDLSRPVDLPEGVREARFLNASFPRVAPAAVRWFACQHFTRDLVWRPEWEAHANGAERLVEAIVVHPSPVQLQATYAELFGEAVRYERECLVVAFPQDTISFLSPRAFQARFPGIALPAVSSEGWFAAAAFRAASRKRVEDVLSQSAVDFSRTPSGSILVPPSEAAGAVLEFLAPA